MPPRILAILQARASSYASPVRILDRPLLASQLERLRRCSLLDKLIVATSSDPSDNAIAN